MPLKEALCSDMNYFMQITRFRVKIPPPGIALFLFIFIILVTLVKGSQILAEIIFYCLVCCILCSTKRIAALYCHVRKAFIIHTPKQTCTNLSHNYENNE